MSKRGYVYRYLLLIKKLKMNPYSSFEELQRFIDWQLSYLLLQDDTLRIGFSKRTLQRDIKEVRNLFGIDIAYSPYQKGYFIEQERAENGNFQRMMEAFDVFNSLNLAQDLAPYIHLEQQRAQGTEHLYGLLHAIKNRRCITFDYRKFWDESLSQRYLEPYALKEYKNRWYLLGKDIPDGRIKRFGLDRLTRLKISDDRFTYPKDYRVQQSQQYCFGIMGATGEDPQDVILSFAPFQGKYIKTLPLHPSQEVLVDTNEELRIKLTVYLTQDLLMELLSYGPHLKVLAPQTLVAQVKRAHQEALGRYSG
jgi:predicted DNA-binding transcriptional regulator YafY